ncbi:MAG TPA: Rrf2 family transcriptional regulator [Kofleriaceae bacterium]|nr:Rrf2 family transcriptional regulator [Kofleriaceae bacterium]
MRRDSRLSVALHALVHMEEQGGVVTSETLAPPMQLNPVVLRRTMAGLRDAGIVRAAKGHGGGWALGRPLASVSLGEVYKALGTPEPFRIGARVDSPGCLVEQAVNRALAGALARAEAVLVAELDGVAVGDIAADVRRKGWPGARKRRRKHA